MEKETWLHIAAGNKEAYAQMYVFFFPRLFNYGRKFTADQNLVEDVAQEVLVSLWNNKDRLSTIQTPHTYLFSSFRYTLFRKLQQQRKWRNLPEQAEPEFPVEHLIVEEETRRDLQQQLQQAMQELTDRQREAIFLRFYEGLSYEEIATILNISVKASYKIMARALLRLHEKLSLPLAVLSTILRSIYTLH